MGLVAEHEVELGRAGSLCLFDHAERLVGAEDHRQRARSGLPQLGLDRAGFGRDRDLQFHQRRILVGPSGPRVRADADVAMRQLLLGGPLTHRLLQQRDGRHQVEHATADPGDLFRDAKGGEGLACSARHDELAPIVGIEAPNDVFQGLPLMRPQPERLAPHPEGLGHFAHQVRPVDRPPIQVGKPQGAAGGHQALDRLPGVRPPLVAGVDDDPGREWPAGRRGDERVDMPLRDARSGRVALALDRAVAAVLLLRHQVDAHFGGVEVGAGARPLGPQPDIRKPLIRVERILQEVALHQALEEAPLVDLRLRRGPDVSQRCLESVRHATRLRSRAGPLDSEDPREVRGRHLSRDTLPETRCLGCRLPGQGLPRPSSTTRCSVTGQVQRLSGIRGLSGAIRRRPELPPRFRQSDGAPPIRRSTRSFHPARFSRTATDSPPAEAPRRRSARSSSSGARAAAGRCRPRSTAR